MSGPTLDHRLYEFYFAYGTFTLFGVTFQSSSAIQSISLAGPKPQTQAPGLASFPFARRYLENRCFFLFLRVLRCFSSPRCLIRTYFTLRAVHGHYSMWVPPFGHPWFTGYVLLPAAFRSLSRPSSAPSAKASALCSSSLGLSASAGSRSLINSSRSLLLAFSVEIVDSTRSCLVSHFR